MIAAYRVQDKSGLEDVLSTIKFCTVNVVWPENEYNSDISCIFWVRFAYSYHQHNTVMKFERVDGWQQSQAGRMDDAMSWEVI